MVSTERVARFPDRDDFSMGCRVMGRQDPIVSSADDPVAQNNNGAEGASFATAEAFASKLDRLLHPLKVFGHVRCARLIPF